MLAARAEDRRAALFTKLKAEGRVINTPEDAFTSVVTPSELAKRSGAKRVWIKAPTLARALELPSTGLQRTYRARAYGRITQPDLDRLRDGIVVDGVEYRSIRARLERSVGANCWIELVLTEGKNREVRRALESLGLKVNRLIRVSYGPFELADLAPGSVAEVSPADLLAEVGEMIAPERRPDPSRPVRALARSSGGKKEAERRVSRDDRPKAGPDRNARRPLRKR